MHLFSVCSNTFSLPVTSEWNSLSKPLTSCSGDWQPSGLLSSSGLWGLPSLSSWEFSLYSLVLFHAYQGIFFISLLWWRALFTSFLRKAHRRRIGVHMLSVCLLSPLFRGQYILGHIHIGGLWLKSALRVSHGSLLAGFDLTRTPGWLNLPLAPKSLVDPCSSSSLWPKMSKPHDSCLFTVFLLHHAHGSLAHGSQSIIGEELEVQTRPCPPAGSPLTYIGHKFVPLGAWDGAQLTEPNWSGLILTFSWWEA